MGDGGEGTALAVEASQGGRWIEVSLSPSRRGGAPQKGRWLDLGNRSALVEFAEGCYDAPTCVARWCGLGFYDRDLMTSSTAPETPTPPHPL